MRPIDADYVIERLDDWCDVICPYLKEKRHVVCGACALGGAFDTVDEAPTIDAEPVRHGRFVDVEGRILSLRCTACGDWFDLDYSEQEEEFKYCPLCGAKMDLEGDDETD